MSVQIIARHRVWPVHAHRIHNNRSGFIIAYGLASLSGLLMGLVMGWVAWG